MNYKLPEKCPVLGVHFTLSTYEPQIVALLQSQLKGGETVMDIGANIGYFTLLMAHLVGVTGRVIAFEPVPSVYVRLCENLQLNLNNLRHVQTECMAISDSERQSQMQFDEDSPMTSTSRLAEGGSLSVRTASVDGYVAASGLDRLDLVKIDVEGAEDAVIRGMSQTLCTLRPVVLVEIHASDRRSSEALSKLKESGYRLRRFEGWKWVSCDTSARGGHVVGVPE